MIELGYNFLQWFRRHHFLYIFGFLLNFKPIDPFLYDMIITSKNVTEIEYNRDAYPISAYTNAVLSFLIFVFIGFCAFNYIFIISCIGGSVLAVFYWQCDTFVQFQVAEAILGCVAAAEIVYQASIYVCFDTNHNLQRLTSYIRAVPLVAKMIAAVLSQNIVLQGWLDYQGLAFLSVPVCSMTLLIIIHLPPMFETDQPPEDCRQCRQKLSWFYSKFKNIFSDGNILKWSLWSAFTLCGHNRVSATMQRLWRSSQLENGDTTYNGTVEAILALLALLAVLSVGNNKINWKFHNSILLLTSLLQAILLFIIASIDEAWIFNICYIVFGVVYYLITTALAAKIAADVDGLGGFGIVFGFIGLISAVLNLIFVCVVTAGMNLTLPVQFIVYGVYYLIIAVLVLISWFRKC